MTILAAEASGALSRMRGKRALLIGDFVLDSYLFGETERVSREAPVLVVRRELEEHRAGAAANTAANLAALGLEVCALGWVGSDAAGHRLVGLLAESGCSADSLVVFDGLSTPVKTRILAGAFGTGRQQVLRIDAYAGRPLPAGLDARLAGALSERAREADVVVASDYGMGTLGPQSVAVLRSLAASGVSVCVDSRDGLKDFAGVTVVTPNVPEAEAFVGHAIDAEADVQAAGRHILSELGCQACLLTQGKRGMTLFRADAAAEHVGVVGGAEVTDVTGAGDTVIATMAASLAADIPWSTGMRLANCAAGVVVMRRGTAAARPEEIVAQASLVRAAPALEAP